MKKFENISTKPGFRNTMVVWYSVLSEKYQFKTKIKNSLKQSRNHPWGFQQG